jgi:hypothetical protein
MISKQFIAPLLLGQDIGSGRQLQQYLSAIKGNQFAKAAFDLAWWDLPAVSINPCGMFSAAQARRSMSEPISA